MTQYNLQHVNNKIFIQYLYYKTAKLCHGNVEAD